MEQKTRKKLGVRRSATDLAKEKYRPEYCQLLREHIANGWSFGSFGGKVQVANETLYIWREQFPEFDEAAKTYKGKGLSYNLSFP
jgi:hypothetical protein